MQAEIFMTKKIVSIRGAVTVKNDETSIRNAVERLITRMYFKNAICDDDVVNIVISSTSDVTALYPARVIRECGHDVPLFSCLEPNIDGSLPLCVRIMITAYSDGLVKNIYLNEARQLRPDLTKSIVIALDGPSGAGKSTVAKIVAQKLNATYLDTGALYRSLGVKVLESGLEPSDEKNVCKLLSGSNVEINLENGMQHVVVDGDDVTDRIRTQPVAMAASTVSAYPFVREMLLETQRNFAKRNSVIVDGRDIGTVVLPDAEFKFYLTAAAEIRAKRRYDELCEKGVNCEYSTILKEVNERDYNDSHRPIAPLKKAVDAIEINSDNITAQEVASKIIAIISEDL